MINSINKFFSLNIKLKSFTNYSSITFPLPPESYILINKNIQT